MPYCNNSSIKIVLDKGDCDFRGKAKDFNKRECISPMTTKSAAEEPYEFCLDFQNEGCNNENCRLVHANRLDILHYECTSNCTFELARALAPLTPGDRVHGKSLCRRFQRGSCAKGHRCFLWHINKREEQRKRFPGGIVQANSLHPQPTKTESSSIPISLNKVRAFREEEPPLPEAQTSMNTSSSSSHSSLQHKNFHHLRNANDAFWEFCFSKHEMDQRRKENLHRIIRIFDQYGKRLSFRQLNEYFGQIYEEELTAKFLRELFSTPLVHKGQELAMFRGCTEVFRVDEQGFINFVLDDEIPGLKNIFVSSTPILNADILRNVKLADKVFEIVPAQRKINLMKLMEQLMESKEYKDVKEKYPEAPPLEPVKFIGFLQLYWKDVFKIIPDYETGEVWVKRQVLHHMKPSQDRVYMKEIMTSLPRFPLPSDILTSTHVVKVHRNKFPTDGVGLQLLSLEGDFKFVKNQLSLYYDEVMSLQDKDERKARLLHPNETFDGMCCLRIEEEVEEGHSKEVFRRCRITGQSNGRAMVQDADHPWHGLMEIKNLYQIPQLLLGIRQTCVYGVFEGFSTKTDNEKEIWDKLCIDMSHSNTRSVAIFQRPAERIDYSGRRKYAVFMATIRLNELGVAKPPRIFPGCA